MVARGLTDRGLSGRPSWLPGRRLRWGLGRTQTWTRTFPFAAEAEAADSADKQETYDAHDKDEIALNILKVKNKRFDRKDYPRDRRAGRHKGRSFECIYRWSLH